MSPRTLRRPALLAVLALLVAALVAPLAVIATAADGVGVAVAATAAPSPSFTVVRQEPCPDSEFTCITLRVARDHLGAAGGTFEVTFGLLPASGKHRKGAFVTVTGGPGTSGLSVADSYTSAFDPRITRDYDIVFFDQRGVGQSEPLQCPAAALDFYSTPAVPTVSDAEARAYATAARQFARDCVVETGVRTADLPYFSTRQAVEDLEAFRIWLGVDKLDLYGESYGTQFVQTYAAAHPSHVRTLYVDGPVDLTLTGFEYYSEDARAFEGALVKTLDRCNETAACATDIVGGDALATYDALAGQLRAGSQSFTFVDAGGGAVTRRFGLGDLETAATGYLYNTADRMVLQRAIGQASRGQLLPLARLAYISLAQDPETLEAIPDPSYSDAMYYAVECMDYEYRTGTPSQSGRAYLAAGRAAGVASVRLGSIFYGDLPCAYWPAHPGTTARPAPLTATPYPIYVLASDWDPATPYAGALRIFNRASNAFLIVQPGGAHVIFGRGNPCPDDIITDYLVRGRLPGSRQTFCEPTGVDDYVAIPAAAVGSADEALAALAAVDDEILNAADYQAWDGLGSLRYGCLFGGSIRYEEAKHGYELTLEACAFSDGLALSGHGTINVDRDAFTLRATAPGGTEITYRRDAHGNRSVAGRWFGHKVH
jgi:pimeloyl-ACP methyl ester carboxylesterase